jgi:hypothetical protein
MSATVKAISINVLKNGLKIGPMHFKSYSIAYHVRDSDLKIFTYRRKTFFATRQGFHITSF